MTPSPRSPPVADTLTQFWFNCFACFSGQKLFDDWYQTLFNLVFTALPVIVIGLLDQDVPRAEALRHPGLYGASRGNAPFRRGAALWLLTAVYQSCACFFLPLGALGQTRHYSAKGARRARQERARHRHGLLPVVWLELWSCLHNGWGERASGF